MDPIPYSIVSQTVQRSDDDSARAEEARRERHRTRDNAAANFKDAMGRKTTPSSSTPAQATPVSPRTLAGSARSEVPPRPPMWSQFRAMPEAINPALRQMAQAAPSPTVLKDTQPVQPMLPVCEREQQKMERENTAQAASAEHSASPENAQLKAASDPQSANLRVVSRVTSEPKRKGAGGDSGGDAAKSDDAAMGPIVASPAAMSQLPQSGPAVPAASAPCLIPSAVLQQVVEFATVGTNADGFMEFQMGLARNALSGLQVRVTSFGNRRVGLNLRSTAGEQAISEEDVAALVDALRGRNVEVVEVEVA